MDFSSSANQLLAELRGRKGGGSKIPSPDQHSFIEYWNLELESYSTEQILLWSVEMFHPRLAFATSLDLGGSVLVSMIALMERQMEIFAVDSGYRFRETRDLHETIRSRFGLDIAQHSHELTVEAYEAIHGGPMYLRNPYRCCFERRIEILNRLAPQYDAWITETRRDQDILYAKLPILSWDEQFGLFRIAPLARWSEKALREKIDRDSLPYNTLLDRGCSNPECRPCSSLERF